MIHANTVPQQIIKLAEPALLQMHVLTVFNHINTPVYCRQDPLSSNTWEDPGCHCQPGIAVELPREWELGIAAAPFHRWENRSQNIQAGNAELV